MHTSLYASLPDAVWQCTGSLKWDTEGTLTPQNWARYTSILWIDNQISGSSRSPCVPSTLFLNVPILLLPLLPYTFVLCSFFPPLVQGNFVCLLELVPWFTGSLVSKLTGWVGCWLFFWFIGGQVGWLGWFVGWLISKLVSYWLLGGLVDWLDHCLADWFEFCSVVFLNTC